MYPTRFFVPYFWNKGHDRLRTQGREPSHRSHGMLLQQICSRLMQHELHAKWLLYQHLIGLTAGLQPLLSHHWWCANRFHHWRYIAACHSAFPSACLSSTRQPGTSWGWPCGPSCWETPSVAGSGELVLWYGTYFCSTPLVRSLCVLDRVFSMRIEDHVDYVSPYAFV